MNSLWPVSQYIFGLCIILVGSVTNNIYMSLSGIGLILGGILYVLDTRLK